MRLILAEDAHRRGPAAARLAARTRGTRIKTWGIIPESANLCENIVGNRLEYLGNTSENQGIERANREETKRGRSRSGGLLAGAVRRVPVKTRVRILASGEVTRR